MIVFSPLGDVTNFTLSNCSQWINRAYTYRVIIDNSDYIQKLKDRDEHIIILRKSSATRREL